MMKMLLNWVRATTTFLDTAGLSTRTRVTWREQIIPWMAGARAGRRRGGQPSATVHKKARMNRQWAPDARYLEQARQRVPAGSGHGFGPTRAAAPSDSNVTMKRKPSYVTCTTRWWQHAAARTLPQLLTSLPELCLPAMRQLRTFLPTGVVLTSRAIRAKA